MTVIQNSKIIDNLRNITKTNQLTTITPKLNTTIMPTIAVDKILTDYFYGQTENTGGDTFILTIPEKMNFYLTFFSIYSDSIMGTNSYINIILAGNAKTLIQTNVQGLTYSDRITEVFKFPLKIVEGDSIELSGNVWIQGYWENKF